MGVITTSVVPAGKVFGPVPPNLTLSDPALLIGHMTCDNKPDIHTVKIDLNECIGDVRAGEWVPYVQPARDEREQNLEAFLKDAQLHYRATRTIAAGEEVLVWYSKEMAAAVGVPELMPFHIREGGVFFCPYCMETFRYPNSLRAHMRFKCEHRRQIHPMGLSTLRPPGPIPRDVHERLFPAIGFDYRTASLEKATHGAFPYPGYPNFRLSMPGSVPASVPMTTSSSAMPSPLSSSSLSSLSSPSRVAVTSSATEVPTAMLPSPASSTSSVGMSTGKHSPDGSDQSSSEGRDAWSNSRSSPGKHSLDEHEQQPPIKRMAANGEREETPIARTSPSPPSRTPPPADRPQSTDSQSSDHSSRRDSPLSVGGGGGGGVPATSMGIPKLDRNQNIHSDLSDDDNLSAFRKVEKRVSLSPPLGSHPPMSNSLYKMDQARVIASSSSSTTSTLFTPTPINGLKVSPVSQPGKTFPSTLPHPSFLPRLALLPGNAGVPPSLMHGPSYNENLPLNMSDLYRTSLNSVKYGGSELVRPASEKLTDIHNIENNNGLHSKMAYMPGSPASMNMRMSPYYKPQNPMVEKLLATSTIPRVAPFAMNLTQNWCAKCNATFRMTSDLVYHMRSHHKQEPLVKKKREDKLKCTVCGESFRERHHLTRHMTSHQ